MITRRSIIKAGLGIIAAPAIIRVADIMPIRMDRSPYHVDVIQVGAVMVVDDDIVFFNGMEWRRFSNGSTWDIRWGPSRQGVFESAPPRHYAGLTTTVADD